MIFLCVIYSDGRIGCSNGHFRYLDGQDIITHKKKRIIVLIYNYSLFRILKKYCKILKCFFCYLSKVIDLFLSLRMVS